MLPSSADWIAALSRMSGKSVTASMSTTPQAWLAKSPRGSAPIASRTRLRAPSQPTTYLARTVVSAPLATSRSVTTTGCSPSGSTFRVDELQAVVGLEPRRRLAHVVEQVLLQAGLVDDEVRELRQAVLGVLDAAGAHDPRAVFAATDARRRSR